MSTMVRANKDFTDLILNGNEIPAMCLIQNEKANYLNIQEQYSKKLM